MTVKNVTGSVGLTSNTSLPARVRGAKRRRAQRAVPMKTSRIPVWSTPPSQEQRKQRDAADEQL